jgi:hypothetical protein
MPDTRHSARGAIFSSILRNTLILSLLLFSVSHRVFAQESTATIVGLVTEPSGAVVPNATIRINVATNTVRTVTTGESGDFNVPFLTAGRYTITVEASGFETRTLEGITVEVGQTARVDSQMKVGTVSEVVQVDSVAVATDRRCRRRHGH